MIANILTSGLGETEIYQNPVFIGDIKVSSGEQELKIELDESPLSIILQ